MDFFALSGGEERKGVERREGEKSEDMTVSTVAAFVLLDGVPEDEGSICFFPACCA